MPQAQVGHSPALKSMPKICRINGDDNLKIIFRNLGNNHAYPFLWADKFTMVSGATEVVVASGIKFHSYDLATYGNVTVTPLADPVGRVYVNKNTSTNVVKVVNTTAAGAGGMDYDVKFMLGVDPSIEDIYCRGNRGAAPSFP